MIYRNTATLYRVCVYDITLYYYKLTKTLSKVDILEHKFLINVAKNELLCHETI